MKAAFFALHSGLPREAPGDADSLAWALDLAKTPARARILDAGCGPGADLALLRAKRPAARLEGLDLHAPFIERIRREQPDVTAGVGDMLAPDGVYDLIWSAGAAYGPGVSAALTAWRDHVDPGGVVAFSDCLWRTPRPAPAARAFWQQDYPGMMDLPGHIARIEGAGYRILGARWLGAAAWEAYYGPLSDRVAALRHDADAEMAQVLNETQAEIELWRAHGGDYGYYLSVVAPA
ncbi:MAG: class I SAM-dependent methyltransferase [Pseudotabrizicola sp.]|uniref:class I SAM-dependent methyltransferase n=1 Tax=Pseudotabrizicola sp. TaxID=2939647 RepID=UPI00273213EB|nr:class I SAM-dependent methyltransferase [Pseudotabrizicola sp.]MDP2082693.1 class I SAM-dependent methyltransferase [Pseudotabrizicola sp.]MDZ7573589.1 class I SAM-dependent methyltransferase [Pseudotabrizicola sp.]